MGRSFKGLRLWAALACAAIATPGCPHLSLSGPDVAPTPETPPRTVSVTVEYRQPNGCGASSGCTDPVVFFASWMRTERGIQMSLDSKTFVWRTTVTGVPVNFPPRDYPYQVRLYDPFLRDGPTRGTTADRLVVGGETLNRFDLPGGPDESAYVYIDENGVGHNPFFN